MEIILSKNSGFCPGVRRADDAIRKLIFEKKHNDLIFTIGDIIHNKSYIDELTTLGVRSIEMSDVNRIVSENSDCRICFVIRTHGLTKEDYEFLMSVQRTAPNVNVIDMTCPSVKKISEFRKEQVDSMWDEVTRFENPHTYYVDLSEELYQLRLDLLNKHSK